jgi:hypothetical protein
MGGLTNPAERHRQTAGHESVVDEAVVEEAVVEEAVVEEAIRYLTPDLEKFLADLDGAPVSLAQAAVQLLPFGSRTLLLETGMAVTECSEDDARAVGLWLTPLGFAVISRVGQSDDPDEIRELAEAAAAIVAAHTALRDRGSLHSSPSQGLASPPVQPRLSRVIQRQPR